MYLKLTRNLHAFRKEGQESTSSPTLLFIVQPGYPALEGEWASVMSNCSLASAEIRKTYVLYILCSSHHHENTVP